MTKQDSKTDRPLVTSNTAENVVLTAYQAGPAVVHEDRHLTLGEGLTRVYIGGLPREFVENSSTIVAVRGTGKFAVGAKSLRPANLSFNAMLEHSIGKKVTFVEEMKNGNLRKITGTLLHLVDSRYAVLEGEHGKGVRVVPLTQKFELDAVPAGLSNLSVLVLDPKVELAGDFTVELLYETGGINWTPKYEVFYDAKAGVLKRFACNVDLTNNSGANFNGVMLNLIAGTNVTDGQPMHRKAAMRGMAMAASMEAFGGAAPQADYAPETAEVETVGEQKMYKLTEPVTLENGIPNSPVLIFREEVPAAQEYHVYSHGYQNLEGDNKSDLTKLPVNVKLRVQNNKDSNLGSDLPPGAVRFFEKDSRGKYQKTNSSTVKGHVAVGEEFSLDLRTACKDLKHTRELVDFYQDPEAEEVEAGEDEGHFPIKPQVGAEIHLPVKPGDVINHAALEKDEEEEKEKPRYAEEEREVTVFNFKSEAVEVIVHESFPANSTFVSTSHAFAKVTPASGSGTLKLMVPPKADKAAFGSASIRYRVRYRMN